MRLEPVQPAVPDPPPIQAFDLVRQRSFGQDIVAPARVDDDGALTATLYRDELAALTPAQAAVFAIGGAGDAPHVRFELQRTADAPAPWDRSTARVRFTFAKGEEPPARGATGWVRIAGKRRELLVIPSSALLEGSDGTYVLALAGDGTLARRSVAIGRVVGGLAYVLSGVAAQERVLVRNTFFLDAERRLHPEVALEATP
jgi:hypothetical protein